LRRPLASDELICDLKVGGKVPSMQRRRRREIEELETLRRHWLERCEEMADRFIEDARQKGSSLGYAKTDLQTLERFLRRQRASIVVRISRKNKFRLVAGASAYLGQVILHNMGGKLGWETSFQTVSVEEVGGQGIKAFPWDRVAELVDEGWGEPLDQYYELIEEAIEARERGEWQLNEDDVWNRAQERVRALREGGRQTLRNTGKMAASVLPLTYCPACGRLDDRENALKRPHPDELRRGFSLLIRSALSDARWDRCSNCGGQLLPVGYSLSTLGWYLLRRSEGGINPPKSEKLSERQEVYITALNTTLQRSVFLRSPVHRIKKEIIEIGEDEEEDLKGGMFLVPLPSTPFYF